jgi:oligopeptide transport system substrate-binding protein
VTRLNFVEDPMNIVRVKTLAVGLVAALLLAACGGDGNDSEGGGGGGGDTSLVLGVPSFFVTNLAPGGTGGSNIDYAVWTPLTTIEAGTGELVAGVAEEWTSEDQKTWTITLQEGWTFHDGSPVTAQSFVDSWNVTATAENALNGNAQMAVIEGYDEMNPAEGKPTADELSGLKAVDETTLEVTLKEPNTLFPYLIANPTFAPLPERAADDIKAFATHPIGNGPYKLRDGGFEPGDQDVFLVPYEDYQGTPANVDEIDLRVYQDPATIYTDFQSGSIDLALLDGDNLAAAQQEYPEQVVDVAFPALVYLGFPAYDDRFTREVREAVSLAIDRQAIVDSLLQGNGTPATGLAPDVLAGGGEADCPSCQFDPDAAADALEAAGGWEGEMVLYTYQDPTNERILEAVTNQIRSNLGIEDVSFEALPIDQLYERFGAQSIDGPSLAYAGASFPHLFALADQMLNPTGYDNPEFTRAMNTAVTKESTIEDTTEQVRAAVDMALADAPVAPLYWPRGGLVHSENVSGVVPEFLGGARLASLEVGS